MSQAFNGAVDSERAAPSELLAANKALNEDAGKAHKSEVQRIPYSAYSPGRRRLFLGIITAAGFFGPLSGAVYLPALPLFEDIFSQSGTVINATVSVYMVAFAIAPLIWASFSDYGGRKPIYLVSLAGFIAANALLAALPANIAALFILRILQAIGASGVTSIGAGTVADITEPRSRASALSIFLLGPQVGPIIGPLIGGQLAESSTWRWIFGFLAISCFMVYILIVLHLPETLRYLVGNGSVFAQTGWVVPLRFRQRQVVDEGRYPRAPRPSPKLYLKVLSYPPIFVVCVTGALLFAAFYAVLVTFPDVLKEVYGFSNAEVGYAYLAPGIALVVGSVTGGKVSDLLRARLQRRDPDNEVAPESRLSLQIFGILLSASGVFTFGWLCAYRVHVAVVLVASVLAAFGMTWVFVTSTSYQTECFPAYAASLVAVAGLLRNPAAAIAIVVIDPLTERMGRQWFFTGLAVMDLLSVLGIGLIIRKGPEYRRAMTEREVKKKETSNRGS